MNPAIATTTLILLIVFIFTCPKDTLAFNSPPSPSRVQPTRVLLYDPTVRPSSLLSVVGDAAKFDDHHDEDEEYGIPPVLRILQTQRPHLSEKILEEMCRRFPLLRQGKVFRIIGARRGNQDDNEADDNVSDDDPFDIFDNDENVGRKSKYRVVPIQLTDQQVEKVVSDLYECGFTDDDLRFMFARDPWLVSSNRLKTNFRYLVELGLAEGFLIRFGRGFPSAFRHDLPRKLQTLRGMGFEREEILHLIRTSRLRVFSYDVNRKVGELSDLGFGEDDIKRLCKRGGNVFGMDIRGRFKRLEDTGFRDVVKLVRLYPQLLALRTKTIKQFVEAGLGLSFEDVIRMAEKCPSILGLNATKAVHRLEELCPPGAPNTVGKLVKAFPQALTYNIDNRVHHLAVLLSNQPCSPSLQEISDARILLGKMFVKYPPILGYDLGSRLTIIEEAGIPRPQALLAMPIFPQLVSYDVKLRIQKLKDAGFSPPLCTSDKLGKLIGSFPPLIGYDIEKKINKLEEQIGLNRTQVLKMVVLYPRIVGVNAERTVKPAVELFLAHNVTLDYLVAHPRVLTRSVEVCLQPRAERLGEIGKSWTPTSLVSLSKRGFEERYGRLGDPAPDWRHGRGWTKTKT